MYSSYTAAVFARKHDLADKHGVNLDGALTWAFEFEDQPYFAGFRALATNGIDLPVLNVFRMLAKMSGQRVAVESSGRSRLDAIMRDGVRGAPDVVRAREPRAEASSRSWSGTITTTIVPGPDAGVQLTLTGLPLAAGEARAHALPHRRHAQQRVRRVETHGLADRADAAAVRRSSKRPASSGGLDAPSSVRVVDRTATIDVRAAATGRVADRHRVGVAVCHPERSEGSAFSRRHKQILRFAQDDYVPFAAVLPSSRTARPTALRLGTVSSSYSRETTMPFAPASYALITH